ncbi:MAG TPA: sulfatase-like hydrolase/transferase [Bryobacteraceae bacterium]|nr:sulfatase-like hydrolase/transferase [Bryobacteraceae bacterium]
MKKAGLVIAHLVFLGFNLLTAFYCLLAYLPFTYHQIHAGHLLSWLDAFARIHPVLNLAILPLAILLAVEPWRMGGLARWLAGGFAILQIAYAAVLTVHPVVDRLSNDSISLWYSVAVLGAVAWVPAADILCYSRNVRWIERPAGFGASQFAATWGAIFVSVLYSLVFLLLRPAGLSSREMAIALSWSLLAHLLFFLGVFLLLECLGLFAGLFRQPARLEFWFAHVVLAAAITALLRLVVWPSIGFAGWREELFSVALGLILSGINAGLALWLMGGQAVSDGIAAATCPATLGRTHSWRAAASVLLVAGIAGAWLAVRGAALDWNYLLQKLTAAAIWLTSFAGFYAIGAGRKRARSAAWIAAPLVLLGAYKGLQAASTADATEPILERCGGYDASFLLVRQLLTPPKREDSSFYQFLSRNTNIGVSVHVAPTSIDLAAPLAVSQDVPHIFIFTIDSLRRDYLSPYNPAVRFTPAIDSFARESTAFENAWTRYGGTGLSEPALWAGALLLHKQYITPFAPMNALEKLVTAERYQLYLSRDAILQTILTPSASAVELDPPEATMTLEFGETLERLEAQIDRRSAGAPPIFAYTQPQNLHISVIQREGTSVPPGEAYPGFYAPYASRVKRIDAAFGKFIEFLKARGLYDRSIVILTADHGDSLGEDGRWGHAYTLFPEVVRIPLIVHLPERLKNKVSADPAGLAFSTDITPSLYYLLGQRPVRRNQLFGAPLFTETAAERQRDAAAQYLLVSSYGAVYGILSAGGRQLYIADGVNYRDYLFGISTAHTSALPLSSGFERQQNDRIRNDIHQINRFYGFGDGAGGSS